MDSFLKNKQNKTNTSTSCVLHWKNPKIWSQASWVLGKKRPVMCPEDLCGQLLSPRLQSPHSPSGGTSNPQVETRKPGLVWLVLKPLLLQGSMSGSGASWSPYTTFSSPPGDPPHTHTHTHLCERLGRRAGVQGGSRTGAGAEGQRLLHLQHARWAPQSWCLS